MWSCIGDTNNRMNKRRSGHVTGVNRTARFCGEGTPLHEPFTLLAQHCCTLRLDNARFSEGTLPMVLNPGIA